MGRQPTAIDRLYEQHRLERERLEAERARALPVAQRARSTVTELRGAARSPAASVRQALLAREKPLSPLVQQEMYRAASTSDAYEELAAYRHLAPVMFACFVDHLAVPIGRGARPTPRGPLFPEPRAEPGIVPSALQDDVFLTAIASHLLVSPHMSPALCLEWAGAQGRWRKLPRAMQRLALETLRDRFAPALAPEALVPLLMSTDPEVCAFVAETCLVGPPPAEPATPGAPQDRTSEPGRAAKDAGPNPRTPAR